MRLASACHSIAISAQAAFTAKLGSSFERCSLAIALSRYFSERMIIAMLRILAGAQDSQSSKTTKIGEDSSTTALFGLLDSRLVRSKCRHARKRDTGVA